MHHPHVSLRKAMTPDVTHSLSSLLVTLHFIEHLRIRKYILFTAVAKRIEILRQDLLSWPIHC